MDLKSRLVGTGIVGRVQGNPNERESTNMLIGAEETARVRILMAGDEMSLEEKINEYLDTHADEILADIVVEQVEYHARNGTIDFGLISVLVMRVKRTAIQAGHSQQAEHPTGFLTPIE